MALKRIVLGAASLSVARVFQLASSFVAIPFLARMLTPHDFGLVALAMSMVVFFTYLSDAGLGRSLLRVSTPDTDAEAWSSAYWGLVLLMLGLSLVIVALAWPTAAFFGEPRLAMIMATLAAAPLLMGLSDIPAVSLLQREKFQWLATAEFASAIAGIVAALWIAALGGGAWALVWQHLAQRIVKALVILPASGFRPRLVLRLERLGEHLNFSVDTVGWSITTFFSRQADTLIVGKVLGAPTLGLYNVAVRVMQLPVNIFAGSLSSVLYPRFVRLRDDGAALRTLILTATTAQAAFVFPPIAAIAAASDAFFGLLLSDRWAGAGEIFTLLATAGAIQTVIGMNGSVLQAIGRTGARLRLTLEFAALWCAAALLLAPFGIRAVALGSSLTTLLYLPRLLQLYLRPIACAPVEFAKALAGPTLVGVTIFLAHRSLTGAAHMDAWSEIGLAVLETLAGYGALLWFGRRAIARQFEVMREMFAT